MCIYSADIQVDSADFTPVTPGIVLPVAVSSTNFLLFSTQIQGL